MILLMRMNGDLEWLWKPVLEQNRWWCEGARLCVHQMSPQRLTRSLTDIPWLLRKASKILWTTFEGRTIVRRNVVSWRNVSNGVRILRRVYTYVWTAWKPAKTSFPCPKTTETHQRCGGIEATCRRGMGGRAIGGPLASRGVAKYGGGEFDAWNSSHMDRVSLVHA
jgi:hypothetical protein